MYIEKVMNARKKYIVGTLLVLIIILASLGVYFVLSQRFLLDRLWKRGIVSENLEASIGYIGCSNTRETVEGYHRVGGTNMWPYDKRYDSGSVVDWAQNAESGNKYWNVFDDLLKEYPNTHTIWWQLCIRHDEEETNYQRTILVLEAIRKRIPNAVIYASALAEYTNGVCEITGTFGIEKAKELVQELDLKNEDVLPGPVLGPMSPIETAKDGCHLSSPDGKRKLGNQMKEFFDERIQRDI